MCNISAVEFVKKKKKTLKAKCWLYFALLKHVKNSKSAFCFTAQLFLFGPSYHKTGAIKQAGSFL